LQNTTELLATHFAGQPNAKCFWSNGLYSLRANISLHTEYQRVWDNNKVIATTRSISDWSCRYRELVFPLQTPFSPTPKMGNTANLWIWPISDPDPASRTMYDQRLAQNQERPSGKRDEDWHPWSVSYGADHAIRDSHDDSDWRKGSFAVS
jgi:hypothetical protein